MAEAMNVPSRLGYKGHQVTASTLESLYLSAMS